MENYKQKHASAEYVAARWGDLAPHVRESIITLVDACMAARGEEQPSEADGRQEQ